MSPFFLDVYSNPHESGRDECAGFTLVLGISQFDELPVEFILFSVLSSCLYRGHGRPIKLFEQLDEFGRAFLGMRKVVCVFHRRDIFLGHSGSLKALDDVALYAPSHWTDKAFRRRRRERGTNLEQLGYERWIVWDPVAHYDLATGFRNPRHLFGHVVGLRREHRTKHRESQVKRTVVDFFQIASIALMKLQP